MPGRYVTFSFDLNMTAMTHLKEKSTYNHNYFELDLSVYGDYIIPEKCNILFEHAEDDSPFTYYSLGYFEDDKFKPMFTWRESELENAPTGLGNSTIVRRG